MSLPTLARLPLRRPLPRLPFPARQCTRTYAKARGLQGPAPSTKRAMRAERNPLDPKALPSDVTEIPKIIPTLHISDAQRSGALPFGPAVALQIINVVTKGLKAGPPTKKLAQEICDEFKIAAADLTLLGSLLHHTRHLASTSYRTRYSIYLLSLASHLSHAPATLELHSLLSRVTPRPAALQNELNSLHTLLQAHADSPTSPSPDAQMYMHFHHLAALRGTTPDFRVAGDILLKKRSLPKQNTAEYTWLRALHYAQLAAEAGNGAGCTQTGAMMQLLADAQPAGDQHAQLRAKTETFYRRACELDDALGHLYLAVFLGFAHAEFGVLIQRAAASGVQEAWGIAGLWYAYYQNAPRAAMEYFKAALRVGRAEVFDYAMDVGEKAGLREMKKLCRQAEKEWEGEGEEAGERLRVALRGKGLEDSVGVGCVRRAREQLRKDRESGVARNPERREGWRAWFGI